MVFFREARGARQDTEVYKGKIEVTRVVTGGSLGSHQQECFLDFPAVPTNLEEFG